MGLWQLIGRQAQHPRGFVGGLLAQVMTRMTFAHSRWTAELLDIQPTDHILEVGFGSGASIRHFASFAMDGRVVGVDVSETMVKMATKKNRKAIREGRVEIVNGSGTNLPLDGDRFDKACTINTVYVMEDLTPVFQEMHRVLKPGGIAAVTFPIREQFQKFRPTRTPGFFLHELDAVMSAFSGAGFSDVRLERNEAAKFGGNCLIGTKAVN